MNTNPSDLYTNALIDAATEHALAYEDDPRECIQTDVMNAFYAGAAWHAGQGHVEALVTELSHSEDLVIKLGDLLRATADALKGPPDPRMLHSTHDLPEWGAKARAVAMLYLAASAPGATHENQGDFIQALNAWRELYSRDLVETTQALAGLAP